MIELLNEWEKMNWKKSQIESDAHDSVCVGTPVGKWCKCRTRQQEIWEWDDFIKKAWSEPQHREQSLSETI